VLCIGGSAADVVDFGSELEPKNTSVLGLRKSRDASQPEMVRRVILGGGVPLVGPQEELHYPSGQTPRGFTSSPGREVK